MYVHHIATLLIYIITLLGFVIIQYTRGHLSPHHWYYSCNCRHHKQHCCCKPKIAPKNCHAYAAKSSVIQVAIDYQKCAITCSHHIEHKMLFPLFISRELVVCYIVTINIITLGITAMTCGANLTVNRRACLQTPGKTHQNLHRMYQSI